MIREVDIKEISDGKKYTSNDLVKVVCDDCSGCSACCRNMDATVLDPFDVYNISKGLNCSFQELLGDKVELDMIDGVILPKLKMSGVNNSCNFLNEEGRCSIHPFRPGICRLFPLGRLYEGESFYYFLQTKECKKTNLSKIKVSKWLGIQNIKRYESYVMTWHNLIKEVGRDIAGMNDPDKVRQAGIMMIKLFYVMPYDTNRDFYQQFEERIGVIKEA